MTQPLVIKHNYRIVIAPRRLGDYGFMTVSERMAEPDPVRRAKLYHERCESMIEQIKRHIDDVGSVYIEHETECSCPYCGNSWTPDEKGYNGCCDEQELERDKELGVTKTEE